MMKPGLVLRDPDIIKDVLIKDHYSFHKNDLKLSEKVDPVLATNPFFSAGEEWRYARKTIAPAFSTNRVRLVYPLMESSARKMVDFLKHYKSDEDVEARSVSLVWSVLAKCLMLIKNRFVLSAYVSFHGSECTPVWLQHRCSMLWSQQDVRVCCCRSKILRRIVLGRSEIHGVSISTKMVARFHSDTVST